MALGPRHSLTNSCLLDAKAALLSTGTRSKAISAQQPLGRSESQGGRGEGRVREQRLLPAPQLYGDLAQHDLLLASLQAQSVSSLRLLPVKSEWPTPVGI